MRRRATCFYAELRFGVDFQYQKNLTFQLLFENQSVFDGNLIDDRANTSNPGGTDVFGRAASTENPGFRVERFWTRYRFEGTPVTLFVGAELKHSRARQNHRSFAGRASNTLRLRVGHRAYYLGDLQGRRSGAAGTTLQVGAAQLLGVTT